MAAARRRARGLARGVTGLIGLGGLAALPMGAALAGPEGARVLHGQAAIQRQGAETVIRQDTPRASLSWESFDIAPGERVRFRQPSTSSVALNTVRSARPSEIRGALEANGQVWIQNRHGVVFGREATVDVGGLLATTARIEETDFAAAEDRFRGEPGMGAVVNEGRIRAGEGGVAFVAPIVENHGEIVSRGGVDLAAATGFAVDLEGDGLLQVVVDPEAAETLELVNDGTIRAEGGAVRLTAAQAEGVRESLVEIGGIVEATGMAEIDGEIVITGGDMARIAGEVTARRGAAGGEVVVNAETVALGSAARIDVSAPEGGGRIEIGPRTSPLPPKRIGVARGAVLAADSTERGTAGRIDFWSEEATIFEGHASAAARGETGDGGFIDISSRGALGFQGTADLSSVGGAYGLLLFDPEDIFVQSPPPGADDPNVLDDGRILFSDPGAGGEDAFVSPAAIAAVAGDVFLQATANVFFNSPVTVDGSALPTGKALTAQALGGDVVVNAPIDVTDGVVLLESVNGSVTVGQPVTVTADTRISEFRVIAVNGVALNAGIQAVSNGLRAAIDIDSASGVAANQQIRGLGERSVIDIFADGGLLVRDIDSEGDVFLEGQTAQVVPNGGTDLFARNLTVTGGTELIFTPRLLQTVQDVTLNAGGSGVNITPDGVATTFDIGRSLTINAAGSGLLMQKTGVEPFTVAVGLDFVVDGGTGPTTVAPDSISVPTEFLLRTDDVTLTGASGPALFDVGLLSGVTGQAVFETTGIALVDTAFSMPGTLILAPTVEAEVAGAVDAAQGFEATSLDVTIREPVTTAGDATLTASDLLRVFDTMDVDGTLTLDGGRVVVSDLGDVGALDIVSGDFVELSSFGGSVAGDITIDAVGQVNFEPEPLTVGGDILVDTDTGFTLQPGEASFDLTLAGDLVVGPRTPGTAIPIEIDQSGGNVVFDVDGALDFDAGTGDILVDADFATALGGDLILSGGVVRINNQEPFSDPEDPRAPIPVSGRVDIDATEEILIDTVLAVDGPGPVTLDAPRIEAGVIILEADGVSVFGTAGGIAAASADVTLTGDRVLVAGDVTSGSGTVTIDATNALFLESAALVGGAETVIDAGGDISQATVLGGALANTIVSTAGDLTVTGQNVEIYGDVNAAGTLVVTATGPGGLDDGRVFIGAQPAGPVPGLTEDYERFGAGPAGTVSAGGDIDIAGGDVDIESALDAGSDLDIAATDLDIAGNIRAGGTFFAAAATVDMVSSAIEAGTLDVEATDTANISPVALDITGAGVSEIEAVNQVVTGTGSVFTVADTLFLTTTADDGAIVSGADIAAGREIDIDPARPDGMGGFFGIDSTTLVTGSLTAGTAPGDGGEVAVYGGATLTIGAPDDTDTAAISATGDVIIGLLESEPNAVTILNDSITAGGTLSIEADVLAIERDFGSGLQAETIDIRFSDTATVAGFAGLQAGGDIDVLGLENSTLFSLLGAGGNTLLAGGSVTIETLGPGSTVEIGRAIEAGGDVSINSPGFLAGRTTIINGNITAGTDPGIVGSVEIYGRTVEFPFGDILADGEIRIDSDDPLTVSTRLESTGDAIALASQSGGIDVSGILDAATTITVAAAGDATVTADLFSGGAVTVSGANATVAPGLADIGPLDVDATAGAAEVTAADTFLADTVAVDGTAGARFAALDAATVADIAGGLSVVSPDGPAQLTAGIPVTVADGVTVAGEAAATIDGDSLVSAGLGIATDIDAEASLTTVSAPLDAGGTIFLDGGVRFSDVAVTASLTADRIRIDASDILTVGPGVTLTATDPGPFPNFLDTAIVLDAPRPDIAPSASFGAEEATVDLAGGGSVGVGGDLSEAEVRALIADVPTLNIVGSILDVGDLDPGAGFALERLRLIADGGDLRIAGDVLGGNVGGTSYALELGGPLTFDIDVTGRLGVDGSTAPPTLRPFSELRFEAQDTVTLAPGVTDGSAILASAGTTVIDIGGDFLMENTNGAAPDPLVRGVGGTGAVLDALRIDNVATLEVYGTIGGETADAAAREVTAGPGFVFAAIHQVNDCALTNPDCQGAPVLGAPAIATDEDMASDPLDISLFVTDPEGDPVVVQSIGGQQIALGGSVPGPQGGTFTLLPDGTLVFEPGDAFQALQVGETANFAVPVEVVDAGGDIGAGSLAVTVTGLNDAPMAMDALLSTDEDMASPTIGAEALGTDPEMDALAFERIAGQAVAPGSEIEVEGGRIVVGADGRLSFDPAGGFDDLGLGESRQIAVPVTVADPGGLAGDATLTVTVTGLNDAPVGMDATLAADEDTVAGALVPEALATDVEMDALSFVLLGGEPVSPGARVALAEGGALVVGQDGTLSFDPEGAFEGLAPGDLREISVPVTIADAAGATAEAALTVTVAGVNDLPSGMAGAIATREDAPSAPLSATGLFTDPEMQALALVSVGGAPVAPGDRIALPEGGFLEVGADGTVTFDPAGAFDDLAEGAGRSFTVEITVEDPAMGMASLPLTISVDGVGGGAGGLVLIPGTLEATEDMASAPLAPDALSGDPGTSGLTVAAIDGVAPGPEGVALAGGGRLFVDAAGNLVFDPGGDFQGLMQGAEFTETVTLTLADAQGLADTTEVTIRIGGLNDLPGAPMGLLPAREDAASDPLGPGALATDPDMDALAVAEIDGQPVAPGAEIALAGGGRLVVDATGALVFEPDGAFEGLMEGETRTLTVPVTLTDPFDGTSTGTLAIEILGANDLPSGMDASLTTSRGSLSPSLAPEAIGTDPDMDALAFTEIAGQPATGPVPVPGGGVVFLDADGRLVFDPQDAFADLGAEESRTVTVPVTVSDPFMGMASGQVTITVTGSGGIGQPGLILTDEDMISAALAPDSLASDPEMNAFAIVTLDGRPAGEALDLGGGRLFVDAEGNLVFDPQDGFQSLRAGESRSFTLLVGLDDGMGDAVSTPVTVTVTGLNDSPVVIPPDGGGGGTGGGVVEIDTPENQPTPGIMPGDIVVDPEMDAVTLVAVDGTPVAPGDTVAIGAGGRLTVTPEGDLVFDPGTDFDGLGVGETAEVPVTLTLADSEGAETMAELLIRIAGANDAPMGGEGSLALTEDAASGLFDPATVANDPDLSDRLTVVSIEGQTVAPGESVALAGGGRLLLAEDGTLVFVPEESFQRLGGGESAVFAVNVAVADGAGETAEVRLGIAVEGINDPPVARDDPASETRGDAPVTLPVLGNDSDVEGDLLTIVAVDGQALSPGSAVPAAGGGVFRLTSEGALVFDPSGEFSGLGFSSESVAFVYEISDGQGGFDTAMSAVTVAALLPPILTGPGQGIENVPQAIAQPSVIEEAVITPDPEIEFGFFSDLTFIAPTLYDEQPVTNRANDEDWPR